MHVLASKPSVVQTTQRLYAFADSLAPVAELLLRVWVARAFFLSGLTKVQSWDSTLQLFEYEYHVPLLSPHAAATLSAFGELCFPVLLSLGFGGRFAAAGLFVLNAVAVASYPGLNDAGLFMHESWGLALLLLGLRGPGKLSLDFLIGRRLRVG